MIRDKTKICLLLYQNLIKQILRKNNYKMNPNNKITFQCDYQKMNNASEKNLQSFTAMTPTYNSNNNYSPIQGNQTTPLLPYHEYMALQRQNSSNQLSVNNYGNIPAQHNYGNTYQNITPVYRGPYQNNQIGYSGYSGNVGQIGQIGQNVQNLYDLKGHNYNYNQQKVNPYQNTNYTPNYLGAQSLKSESKIQSMNSIKSISQKQLDSRVKQDNFQSPAKLTPTKTVELQKQYGAKKPQLKSYNGQTTINHKYESPSKNPQNRNENYRNYQNNNNYKQQKHFNTNNYNQFKEDQYLNHSSNEGWSQEQQEQQMLYQRYQAKKNSYYAQAKNKPIKKKQTPLDQPDEIRKWIQARKKNYPGLRKKQMQEMRKQNAKKQVQDQQQIVDQIMDDKQRNEMSRLEYKIRKKLIIVNGDARSIMKKIKNIQILRRIVQDPKILKKQRKTNYRSNQFNQNNKYQQQNNYKQKENNKYPQPQVNTYPEVINQNNQKIESQTSNKFDAQTQLRRRIPKPLQMRVQAIQEQHSSQQVEPQELPANKIPSSLPYEIKQGQEQQLGELKQTNQMKEIDKQNWFENNKTEKNQKQQKIPDFFQLLQNNSHAQTQTKYKEQKPYNNQQKRQYQPKILDPETIIAHLKQKQLEDTESLNKLFDYKSNSHSYKYRVQTLQTSLKLDDIFAETTYLLQAIRYLVKQNFFDSKTTTTAT